MKKIIFIILSVFLLANLHGQTLKFEWVESPQGESESYAFKTATNISGDNYVSGQFSSATLTLGSYVLNNPTNNLRQVYLAKYNSQGTVIWAKHYSCPGESHIDGMTIDADENLIIMGRFSQTITFGAITLSNVNPYNLSVFMGKIFPTGEVMWMTGLGNSSTTLVTSFAYDLASDNTGNIYIAGDYTQGDFIINDSLTLPNTGPNNYFVAKFNSEGILQWAKNGHTSATIGSPGWESTIDVDTSGNVYLSGPFNSSISFDSTGVSNTNSGIRTFLTKFNSDGQPQFVTQFGDTGYVYPKDLKIDYNDKLYLLGGFGQTDLLLGST
ncbi:hypothetical protein GSB9_00637 [Flavobacteriaceae bacterium GSB9]|nr:hypothetical protein GSB9_00637 [Flavobacteriaceae bacterium GSB9]